MRAAKGDPQAGGDGASVLSSLLQKLRPSGMQAAAKAGVDIVPHPDLPISHAPLPESLVHQLRDVPVPSHPDLVSGTLPNGLAFVILRNQSPPGRVEAHLEVFSGAADELDHEQGLAHVVEHVSYMGNSARERLLQQCAAQTNAYTDFHHTVFYASMDSEGASPRPLRLALLALREVLEANLTATRLEQERAAVLSEMTMVNTIEYRTECALLAALHAENRLARRFPIGLEECIRSWTLEDVAAYHARHYCPSNAVLYVVGDVDAENARTLIADVLAPVARRRTPGALAPEYAEGVLAGSLKQLQSRAFPPIVHAFTGEAPAERPSGELAPLPRDGLLSVFRHPLLQGFSLHVFSKTRITPLLTLADLKRVILQRIVAAALQIRFNVTSRGALHASEPHSGGADSSTAIQMEHETQEQQSLSSTATVGGEDGAAFNFVEFLQMDSAREACAVASLDMVSAREMWPHAVRLGVHEMRRIGVHGVTASELERYTRAVLQDSQQLAAQSDRLSNADQIQGLMEAVATRSIFAHASDLHRATSMVVADITLEEVNREAASMCRHVMTQADLEASPLGADARERDRQALFEPLVVACVPTSGSFDITDAALRDAIAAAQLEPIEASDEVLVPEELLDSKSKHALLEAMRLLEAQSSSLLVRALFDRPISTGITSAPELQQYALTNGIRLNVVRAIGQPGRAHLRLAVPGGRMVEPTNAVGAVAVGARTLQEGGAFEPWSRQQVELFCVDNMIQVEVGASLEFLTLDIGFPVDLLPSALTLVNRIVEKQVRLEPDALLRAKQAFEQAAGEVERSLEDSAVEQLLSQLSGGNPRVLSIGAEHLSTLTLEQVDAAVSEHLNTELCEISLAGDIDSLESVLPDIKLYLGTIRASPAPRLGAACTNAAVPTATAGAGTEQRHFQRIEFDDTDERAIAFLAGMAPSWWGYMSSGESLVEEGTATSSGELDLDNQAHRRAHPLFASTASALLQEVLNRRLFSALRETERLTYDAKFNILGSDRLHGAYYLAEVTAAPDTVTRALQLMMRTLRSVQSGERRIYEDNVRNARKSVMSRHNAEIEKNAYVCELCMGMQMECMPRKSASYLRELPAVVAAMRPEDLVHVLQRVALPSKACEDSLGAVLTPAGAPDADGDALTVSCVAVSSMSEQLIADLELSADDVAMAAHSSTASRSASSTALSH